MSVSIFLNLYFVSFEASFHPLNCDSLEQFDLTFFFFSSSTVFFLALAGLFCGVILFFNSARKFK